MIADVRKVLQGNQYILVFFVLILGGIWVLPPLLQQSTQGQGSIATVNGQEVPYADFAQNLRAQQEYIASLRAQFGQFADDFLRSMGLGPDPQMLVAHVFEVSVREALLGQLKNSMGVQVHPDYIMEKLHDPEFAQQEFARLMPPGAFDEFGGINMRALEFYLRQVGMTISDFEQKIEELLERRTMLEAVRAGMYVPDFQIKDRYKADHLGKKYSVLTLDRSAFIKKEKGISVSDEELQAFFDRENMRQQKYFVPEKRSGKVWKFSAAAYGITVDDGDIQSYYDANKVKLFLDKPAQMQVRRILFAVSNEAETQAVYDKAQRVREGLIANPVSFAEIAKEVSDDKETAKNGGLTPFFAKKDKEKVFSKAAFLLKNDGDISDIIRTKDGFEILQRVARQESAYKNLQSVKSDIQKTLSQKRFEKQFVKDMRAVMQGDEKALAAFVKNRHGVLGKVGPVEASSEDKAAQKLFGLSQGKFAFYVEGDQGVAIQLTDVAKRHLPDLASIKDAVLSDLYEQRAVKKMQNYLEAVKKEVRIGTELKTAQGDMPGRIEQTSQLKKEDTDALQNLKNRGLPVDRMIMLIHPGAVITAQDNEHGYIIRLDEIEPFDSEQYASKRIEVLRALERDISGLFNEAFVASLYRNATIKPNKSLITLGK